MTMLIPVTHDLNVNTQRPEIGSEISFPTEPILTVFSPASTVFFQTAHWVLDVFVSAYMSVHSWTYQHCTGIIAQHNNVIQAYFRVTIPFHPSLPALWKFQHLVQTQTHSRTDELKRPHESDCVCVRVSLCVWETDGQNKVRARLMSDEKTMHTCRYFNVAHCLTSGTMDPASSLWCQILEPKATDLSTAHAFPSMLHGCLKNLFR